MYKTASLKRALYFVCVIVKYYLHLGVMHVVCTFKQTIDQVYKYQHGI